MKRNRNMAFFVLFAIVIVFTLSNLNVHASSSASSDEAASIAKDDSNKHLANEDENSIFTKRDENKRFNKGESERKESEEENKLEQSNKVDEKSFIQTYMVMIVSIAIFILFLVLFLYKGAEILRRINMRKQVILTVSVLNIMIVVCSLFASIKVNIIGTELKSIAEEDMP